jgi:bifunctional non-homologous end joining protein LigD
MDLRPMLASLAEAPLQQKGLVYEPKYDGIRALIEISTAAGTAKARIWSRNGNEKTAQFPKIVRALEAAGGKLKEPVILDGEIVALDEHGRPAGFQRLQGRMHLRDERDVARAELAQPVRLIVFDILKDGVDLTRLPLTERRKRLETMFARLFRRSQDATVRLSEQVAADARPLHARAIEEKWEGLIAKDAASPYQPGRRSPAWRKVKLVQQQEFIVGGWTEPRQTRQHFGALLLGVFDHDVLKYVGHTGTGFDGAELARVWKLLQPLETRRSPFSEPIKTNEPAHWVRPELVAQVRFTEWTADDKLRHPVYLGLRDDKVAAEVHREGSASSLKARGAPPPRALRASRDGKMSPSVRFDKQSSVIEQLRGLEDARRDGAIELPDGTRIGVTNLAKVFWPALRLTKGDLLRYYAGVSPLILPAVADRPLVMKRFPNGIDGKAFYQQRSEKENPPPEVRVEALPDDADPIGEPNARRFVGGSLVTLLYMTQIAAISQDPWFSRVQLPQDADYVAIDLDPGEGTTFDRVIDVARWVHDELESLNVPSVPKTSGSRGIHVYIPLRPGTSYESGMLFCQIVATVVAGRHPKIATVERTVRARARGTVYVDYLQNILGKTLATAYSARASTFAGVSTPLDWKEIDAHLDPRDFTIVTAPARFREVGDIWARLRTVRPANLEAVFRKYR